MLKIKNGRRFYMKKSTIANGSSHRLRPQNIRKSSGTVQQNECAIVTDGKLIEWLEVHVGLRPGCLFTRKLFNIILKFVMEETKCNKVEQEEKWCEC